MGCQGRRQNILQRQLASLTLLIIDELGFVPLSRTGAELLFEVFSQRYERGSILVTTNLPGPQALPGPPDHLPQAGDDGQQEQEGP